MKTIVKKDELKGLSVYADEFIDSGEIIESCHVLRTDIDISTFSPDNLSRFHFMWYGGSAIALGNGSLYNHSFKPNATYIRDKVNNKMLFVSIKDIEIGEEICTNYLGSPFIETDEENYLKFNIIE